MFHPRGPTFRELVTQALSSTERGYDLLAPKFDYTPFRTPDALLEVVAAALGPPRSVARALDVCCGTGAAMRALRPLCRDGIVGVDLSRAMLAQARVALATAPGEAPIELVRADALALPFQGEFDLATCFGAFGHIEPRDEPRFVRSVARALAPGGRFAFVTAPPPPVASRAFWAARAFNGVMRVRNALIAPPFVMYYLTFTLPRAVARLDAAGFGVEIRRGLFAPPWERYVLVVATRGRGAQP